MARRSLIHPKATRAIGLDKWPHEITVLVRVEDQDDIGQPIEAWATLEDHEGLVCIIGSARQQSQRLPNQTPIIGLMAVSVKGWYPAIEPEMHVVDQDGIIYTVLGRTWDSAKITTHLDVQTVNEVGV